MFEIPRHGRQTFSFLLNVAALTLSVAVAAAGDDQADLSVITHGFLAYDEGQIVKGYSTARNIDIDHSWQQKLLMQLGLEATIGERLRIILSPELALTFSYLEWEAYDETHLPGYRIYPNRAEGIYRFGSIERPFLQIGVGLFPFKYNPDVRNLGEYLFRSGPNGIYKLGDFDFAQTRLLGFHASSILFDRLNQHLLFYGEYNGIIALQDYSLAYLADYSTGRLFNVGIGGVAHNLISVNKSRTTPKTDQNRYVVRDTLADGSTVVTDSGYFSYAGQKLMARASIDPKALFVSKLLKKDDLRLYGEIDLLGLDDYPVKYADITKRFVYSAGLNIPTHPLISYGALIALQLASLYEPWTDKVQVPASWASAAGTAALGGATWAVRRFLHLDFGMDILALELSWDPGDYPNNFYYLFDGFQGHLPQPFPAMTQREKWYWSIYAAKQVTKGFELHAQIARDRMRPIIHSAHYIEYEEVLEKANHWHWDLRAQFGF
jgi:hypothetical protein